MLSQKQWILPKKIGYYRRVSRGNFAPSLSHSKTGAAAVTDTKGNILEKQVL